MEEDSVGAKESRWHWFGDDFNTLASYMTICIGP